ncbi:MAG: T9SS type A sorting domain-containing protein [Ignavibacteria bacterium]|nr:T9SS type A sorting domain-containing protein [Ignavibacteria bacterium]
MKKLFILILIFISSNLYPQFSPVDGPYGGQVNAVKKCGSFLFAGTYGAGIYRSTDNGLNWEECNNGINNFNINSLESKGSIVYAGTFGGGVNLSTDFGNSWTQINAGLVSPFVNKLLLIDDTLWAGCVIGLYKLSNGTWQDVPVIFNNAYASKIIASGNIIFAIDNQFLYKSSNRGVNWTWIHYPSDIYFANDFALKDNYLYVLSQKLYKFHIDSLVWRDLGTPFNTANTPFRLSSDANSVYLGVTNEVYKSTNNGASFTNILSDSSNRFVPNSFYLDGSNIYITSEKGIMSTSAASINWSYKNAGIRNLSISNISFSSGEIFCSSVKSIYRSYPADNLWSVLYTVNNTYTNSLATCCERRNTSTLYIGRDYSQSILRSTNNGVSWSSPLLFGSGGEIDCISFKNTQVIFAGGGVHVLDETDPWGLADDYYTNGKINQIYLFGDNFFACSDTAGVYKFSPDTSWAGSYNFDTVNTGLNSRKIYGITSIGNTLFAVGRDGIYKANAVNINWTRIFSTASNSSFFKILNINNILVICSSNYIYTSLDAGNTWNLLYMASLNKTIKTMGNNSDYLYVSIGNAGLIKRPVASLIGVNQISSEIPKNYMLHQNFPNPFNPSTKISYDIIKGGNVSLNVFDINGKEIAKIVNRYQSPGKYETDFDGRNLSSGIYFYRIIVNGFSDTKRMILVK